jgi:hypothetical protein
LFDLGVFGVSVSRGAAFKDVGDIDLRALESHGVYHFRQERAGWAYEWDALFVLFPSWTFSDEHQFGVCVSRAEYHVASFVGEWAGLA